ncbi:hypothetical protein NCS56_01515100 [Fusarium sp. Ph1]|nr:hypothetical protein NCS56_01515100 [Fusarium sp. Ph1]
MLSQMPAPKLRLFSAAGRDVQVKLHRLYQEDRGASLDNLLELSDKDTSRESSLTCHTKIISTSEWFWLLSDHCNINQGRAGETGDYKRIVLKGFKALIKYIQRKAIDFGALANLPADRTGRLDIASPATTRTAPLVPWPAKPINKSNDTGLSSSRWSSNKSGALPDLSQLSLDDGVYHLRIVLSKGGLVKVYIHLPELSRIWLTRCGMCSSQRVRAAATEKLVRGREGRSASLTKGRTGKAAGGPRKGKK